VFANNANLGKHTASNGRGIVLRSADGVTVSNTLIHGYKTGIDRGERVWLLDGPPA
jgi:hypothetical protein